MGSLHCPHVGVCGGCVDYTPYEKQLEAKLLRTKEEFASLYSDIIELYPSSVLGYRARAEFRFFRDDKRDKNECENKLDSSFSESRANARSNALAKVSPCNTQGRLHFAMNAQGANHRIPISSCPILLPSLKALMPPLLKALNEREILSHKIYGCNLLSTLPLSLEPKGQESELIITLIYHKSLDEEWSKAAASLKQELGRLHNGTLHIIGRAKNQKLLLSSEFVNEKIELFVRKNEASEDVKSLDIQSESKPLESKISESSQNFEALPPQHYIFTKQEARFSQPNPAINRKMLEFIIRSLYKEGILDKSCDLLELYCGGGNFTLALAPHFRRVLATEVVKSAITLLYQNMSQNNITNITPVRLNASESISALRGEREFFRLRGVDMDFNFGAVLVDPPRSGINDRAVLEFLCEFLYIVYISCNPTSLKQDLEILAKSHKILHFALFDQFPHTEHRECAVILKRKDF